MSQIKAAENALAPDTPTTGYAIIYPKSDGLWYSKDDAGTETPLGDIDHALLDSTIHTDVLTATVTRGALIVGNSTPKWSKLTIGSNARVLRSDGTDASWAQVVLTTDVTGDLPFANLAQGSALSVLGVTGNGTADVASIAAGTDNQVLRRSGTAVAFGAVNLASSDAITGDLPFANLTPASAASKLLGRGSAGGAGDYEEISIGASLSMSTTTLSVAAIALLDGSQHSDTASGSATRGDIIYANSTPKWARLAKGTAGYILQSDGTDTAWGAKERTNGTTSSAAPTPNADTTDMYTLTALAEAATFGAPSGTPYNGQKLLIRIKDNGTARALSWNAIYVAGGTALPTTTVLSKILHVGFIYNTDNSLNKWMCVGSQQEA